MPSSGERDGGDSKLHQVPPPSTRSQPMSARLRTNQPSSAGTTPVSVRSSFASSGTSPPYPGGRSRAAARARRGRGADRARRGSLAPRAGRTRTRARCRAPSSRPRSRSGRGPGATRRRAGSRARDRRSPPSGSRHGARRPTRSFTNRSSERWTASVDDLVGRELLVERDVAEAAGDEPSVSAGASSRSHAARSAESRTAARRAARSRSPARGSGRSAPRARRAARSGSRRSRRRRVRPEVREGRDALLLDDLRARRGGGPASCRTHRAGWSTPSVGWRIAAVNRPPRGPAERVDPLGLEAVRRRALRTRRAAPRAPRRPRRAEGCRRAGRRRPRARSIAPSSSSVQRQRARARSRPNDWRRPRRRGAPPRSAKPPFRPLARSAIRAPRRRRTRSPPRRGRARTRSPSRRRRRSPTSTCPSRSPRGSGCVGSSSQYGVVTARSTAAPTPSSTATRPRARAASSAAARAQPAASPVARPSSSAVTAPVAERLEHGGAAAIVRHGRGCGADLETEQPRARRRRRSPASHQPQQRVRPAAEGARDLAGHGKHLAAVLEREVGGDQRAASLARLDDDGRRGEAGDDPVAGGNRHGAGSTPGSYSETRRPPAATIARASSACAAG